MPPPPGTRAPAREIAELRALAERQPELAPAAVLHADLVEAVRRLQTRITTPWLDMPADVIQSRLAVGIPLLSFAAIAIDWTEARLLFRQVTDILRRHDQIDGLGAAALHGLGRSPGVVQRAEAWYTRPAQRAPTTNTLVQGPAAPADLPPNGHVHEEMADEVLLWALRPFLIRAAEVFQQRTSFDTWARSYCPVCADEPAFAVVTSSGERQLLCGRCHTRWRFDAHTCPFCGNADRTRLRSLVTPDRLYRVTKCGQCARYVKALDSRAAGRMLLPFYDPVATLPLDAALMGS